MKNTLHKPQIIQRIDKVILSNLGNPNFSIPDICEELSLSRTTLHRKIKKHTDLPTTHYIRSIRLEKAKEFLETSDFNISEVAFRVGFKSPAYFTRLFKKQFKQSPSVFRKKILKQ